MTVAISYISSTSNELVKRWKKLQIDPKERKTCELVLIEGKNQIVELYHKQCITYLIVEETVQLPKDLCLAPHYRVSNHVYKYFTQLENPEGVAAVARIPEAQSFNKSTKLLILDRIQDPGNLGTLLRTAAAFGFQDVVCIPPICDVWNPKTIRAAKGAHFALNIIMGSPTEIELWSQQPNSHLYVADLEGISADKLSDIQAPVGIVLSNEAQGPQKLFKEIGTKVTIPTSDTTESLNVAQAGSILMFLLRNR